jgi:tetratricopeptide (TPR) repeat protein
VQDQIKKNLAMGLRERGDMKQTHRDKHMIAWFKIAECVSRGEKERALGVYRLLSHSFNDKAVAQQLEADINLAFGESQLAVPLYISAVELYQKSQRFLEAVAVCEHLIAINADDMLVKREAIKLYNELHNTRKACQHIEKAIDVLLFVGQDHQVQEFLAFLRGISDELHEYALGYRDAGGHL